MEQTLPLNEAAAPRKKHPYQIIAAVLFTLFMIVNIADVLGIINKAMDVYRIQTLSVPDIIKVYRYKAILCGILLMAAFAMLIPLAANKATKTAAILLIVGTGLTISPRGFFDILGLILGIYAYSLILRNNQLDRGISWWIALLVISYGIALFWKLWWTFARSIDLDLDIIFYNTTIIFQIFDLLFSVLLIISYIKLARCAAFAGKESAPQLPEKAYSPLNKYMAALLITPAVLILFLWLHARFLAPMMGY